jgi:carnitine 3-dehydrogenase
MTPRQMERVRDDNLVGMMRALKRTDWGAGSTLNAHERALLPDGAVSKEPIELFSRQIPQSWLDYNGHMNEAHYLELFSQGNDRIMALVGSDDDYIGRGLSFFTVETHIRHLDELHAGDCVRVTTQVLEGAGKKLRVFHRLETTDGRLAATGEHLMVHVNLESRKSCEPEEPVISRLSAYARAHADLPLPEGAGRSIG